MIRTLPIIGKGAPEYKLAGAFPSLANIAAKEPLVCSIASSAMKKDNQGLIRPNNNLLVITGLVTMGEAPIKPFLPYLFRQPRLPGRLSLAEANFLKDLFD